MNEDAKKKLLSLSFININGAQPRPRLEQCWVDGSDCPYGRPEGQFALRPNSFCRPKVREVGCIKLSDHSDDILEALGEEAPETLMGWLSANQPKRISQIISEIVENEITDEDERIVLASAIGIIQGDKETDPEIFLADDLTDE